MRDYGICLPMLEHLGIAEIKLMTNNPRKVKALQGFGIRVAERKPLQIAHNPYNRNYLATKAGKLGHMSARFTKAKPSSRDARRRPSPART